MSFQQLHDFLTALAANPRKNLGNEVAKIQAAWYGINDGSYPLSLGEFVAQVAASAPVGSFAKGELEALSSHLGASGKSPKQLLAGDEAADQYTKDLAVAESYGGFGADGGKGGPSSVARQNEGALAALRLAGAAVGSGSAHGRALQKEKEKMANLDPDTLVELSAFVPDPPVIGGESSCPGSNAASASDINLNTIYFWGSGAIFICNGHVFKVGPVRSCFFCSCLPFLCNQLITASWVQMLKAVGKVERPYQKTKQDDLYESTLLAIKYGTCEKVDKKLTGDGTKWITARYQGKEKRGLTYPYRPNVSDNMLRLESFVGFTADDVDLANIYLKFNDDGSVDDLKNEWGPAKYDCLSYVDWDIAPKDKTVTPSKRAAKAVSKGKKVEKTNIGFTTEEAICIDD